MHWQIGKGGGFHFAAAEAADRSLPVSVSLGGPPALLLAALAPLPENVPELLLASFLLGRKLPLARGSNLPHAVPADAEVCLIGEVRAGERRPEGPFGDHYGYYSLQHDFPVFHCQQVYHRSDAVVPATVVGKPCQEDYHLGEYLQELLAPLFPLAMPGVRDLWSYGETGFHSLAAAVVADRYRREAMSSAFRILGEGQLALTKFLLVVDRPLDLRDVRAVIQHVLERVDPATDVYLFAHLSMDTLDYAGPRLNEGSKGILLGVGEARRRLPREFEGSLPGVRRSEVFCPGCLVLELEDPSGDSDPVARLCEIESLARWPLVVLHDDARRAARDPTSFLWATFTRFDPVRDLRSGKPEMVAGAVAHRLPLFLDARMKDRYPAELEPDPAIADRVDRRWSELFPSGMEQGSSRWGHVAPKSG